MNYVDLNVVRYAAMVLVNAEENRQTVGCEHDTENGICGEPAEYLVPDATRPGEGQDIEQRPPCSVGSTWRRCWGIPLSSSRYSGASSDRTNRSLTDRAGVSSWAAPAFAERRMSGRAVFLIFGYRTFVCSVLD